jgi:drug/metabolite transporter (DMT)-like permease
MAGMQTAIYTILALIAFAANSVLCRVALRNGAIDPASFSTIRFASGALTLLLVTSFTGKRALTAGSWASAGILFLYAIPFSFAYTRLSASAGALILFGVVQLTMISAGLWAGERPRPSQWFGLGLSLVGLIYLLLPGIGTPSLPGAALMGMAGFFWGVYSLRGRGAASPLAQTSSNFVRSVPLLLSASLLTIPQLHIEGIGALFAVMSGVAASGAGYVIWYSALRGLSATRAAVVQLAVPILAAAGSVAFLGETLSPRLVIASVMVLCGIAIAIGGRPVVPSFPQMTNEK